MGGQVWFYRDAARSASYLLFVSYQLRNLRL
jgi:hypothetical protein